MLLGREISQNEKLAVPIASWLVDVLTTVHVIAVIDQTSCFFQEPVQMLIFYSMSGADIPVSYEKSR